MSYGSLLFALGGETILVITILVLLGLDLLGLRGVERPHRVLLLGLVAIVGCVAGILWTIAFPQDVNVESGMLVLDGSRRLVKVALIGFAIATAVLSMALESTRHLSEYLALILLATIGMLFLVSSENLLLLFVSLELTSICLYILTAFNKSSVRSAEAALKYFLIGSASAAFTLYGLSLLYGLCGSLHLAQVAAAIRGTGLDPFVVLALVMVSGGFAFKVAAVPFHLWAPDVYEGAPIPSAAFIASGSKVAGFFVLARVMSGGLAGSEGSAAWQSFQPGWMPLVSLLAAGSMFLGNMAALAQTSVRRLLAYSAIAHTGYMLLGVLCLPGSGLAPLMYYVITYGASTVGAFGVVWVVQANTPQGDCVANFAGLSRRSPLLAACMLIFLLSLAGIPPLAGFFGKFYVFASALDTTPKLSLLWLVILALVFSAVSLYYYLQVLKQIYVTESAPEATPVRVPLAVAVILLMTALLVVLFGCFPELLVRAFQK